LRRCVFVRSNSASLTQRIGPLRAPLDLKQRGLQT
jgi:hypothetical protein